MNFQSSCYCHTTSYTLSINLQFIAPKKKTVSLQNQIHKTIHLFSHNYIMTSAFCCYPVTSCVQFFVTPWTAACQASLSFTVSQSLLKLMSIESVMPYTILSSVIRFSSCLQSFPASGSFQMSQFLASGSQSIGASASVTVLPMNIQS